MITDQIEKCVSLAKRYAERGWHVVPDHGIEDGGCTCADGFMCRSPGKHPRIEREEDPEGIRRVGTIDPKQIEQWWERWPNSNVAIVTGKHSGILAVDIDIKNDGARSIYEKEKRHGKLPDSIKSKTGSGGNHILFKHPNRFEVRNRIGLYPGVDIKADGGRIVAPPSLHFTGGIYHWEKDLSEQVLENIPSWLLTDIQNAKGTGTRAALRKVQMDYRRFGQNRWTPATVDAVFGRSRK